jgi:hypothetical protein
MQPSIDICLIIQETETSRHTNRCDKNIIASKGPMSVDGGSVDMNKYTDIFEALDEGKGIRTKNSTS